MQEIRQRKGGGARSGQARWTAKLIKDETRLCQILAKRIRVAVCWAIMHYSGIQYEHEFSRRLEASQDSRELGMEPSSALGHDVHPWGPYEE